MQSLNPLHLVVLVVLIGVTVSSALPVSAPSMSFKEAASNDNLKVYDQADLNALYRNYMPRQNFFGAPFKRATHQMELRSMNQFKNCYFSPVQCVLLERRR